MLFEMLTGKRPYDSKDKVALLGQHVAGPIPSLRGRAPSIALSGELETVITKLLAKSPSDRFADALTAAEALASVTQIEGSPSSHMRATNPVSSYSLAPSTPRNSVASHDTPRDSLGAPIEISPSEERTRSLELAKAERPPTTPPPVHASVRARRPR